MKEGKTLTFVELVKEVNWIQIPILQRDYAQGRKDASDVRRQFIQAIKQTLITNEEELRHPLDLDFVYGSFEGANSDIFSVLDGQQRLTTLFLLHWYLAVKENKLKQFEQSFINGRYSKFTYQTRTSAGEFFNSIAISKDVLVSPLQDDISKEITNKRWFFLSWKNDPTVQACLRMLDSIHSEFSSCSGELYERLTNISHPYIVFQYLNLESFGLSDELYIKMNARGKPLTDFENFKAWLCGRVKGLDMGKEFEKKLDQRWTDIFWNMSRNKNAEFDTLYLRFFNLMAFFDSCEKTERSYDFLTGSDKQWISRLRTAKGHISTDEFYSHDSFNELNLKKIDSILDFFSEHTEKKYSFELFEEVLNSSDYVRQAKFYAMLLFVWQASKEGMLAVEFDQKFCNWNRVTNNLINNHRIDELSSFVPVVRALKELSLHWSDLYGFLARNVLEAGFTKSQREEESLKARLILENNIWDNLFSQFESHPYLQGKIGFLLDIARTNDDDGYDPEKFKTMAVKASSLLNEGILDSDEFILERALLTLGDYLVPDNSNRYSFCVPNRNTYRERSENWLKVVSTPVFKLLLERVSDDVETSLKKLISEVNCGGWREMIVSNPDVISYCRNRLIHKERELIYLLTKSTFRGYHSELRTFVLKKILSYKYLNNLLPDNIKFVSYREVYGDDYPCLIVNFTDGISLSLGYDSKGFFVFDGYDDYRSPIELDMPISLQHLIQEIFPKEAIR